MALSPHSQSKIAETLKYFDKYDYPLTSEELYFWSGVHSPKKLPLVKLRKQREKFSRPKWVIAHQVAQELKRFLFIQAIFVTGSLAMNNTKPDDDIDLMIITAPDALWITRFFVNIFLFTKRRFPGQKTAPDKICINLWLDIKNLKLKIKNLYVAHEVLQAKCIFDRNNIHQQFLLENSWVKKYLPHTYLTLSPSPKLRRGKPQQGEVLIKIANLIFYILQYLYMLPKMTTEKVGLGFAFFHPGDRIAKSS